MNQLAALLKKTPREGASSLPVNKSRAAIEHGFQVAVFDYIEHRIGQEPLFALAHAIPNGGKRSPLTGAIMAAEGVRPGVLDIDWPVPKITQTGQRFHVAGGLRVEMKAPGERPSKLQNYWGTSVAFGQHVVVCDSIEAAVEAFQSYERLNFPAWFNVEGARMAAALYWQQLTSEREARKQKALVKRATASMARRTQKRIGDAW